MHLFNFFFFTNLKIKEEPGENMYARKKEESGENSSNSMDVTMDSKGKSEAGDNQEARNSPLPSVSTASAPATPATPATPSTSQTKQPRQKKGQSCQI